MTAGDDYINAIEAGDTATAERIAKQLDDDTVKHAADQQARLTGPDALLNAALWYASKGIPTFPLQPRSKQPYERSHGFKDASTDPDQIRTWWTRAPDSNIGLATGHLFDVVDCDGPEGIAALYNGEPAMVDALTVFGVALTAGGPGRRHLYVPASGRGNGAKILPSVDYRGASGYCVAPPSVGANGNRYSWLQPLVLP